MSDGTFLLDGGCVFGPVPKAKWELDIKPDRRNRIRLGLNCLLIQAPDANILVDTGAGSKRAEKFKDLYNLNGNKLARGLRSLGLTARDIDIVILTQLRFDRTGGCTKLDRSGNTIPTFPKAKHLVQRRCYEEALSPNERFKASFYEDDFLPLEEKGLLTLLDGDTEIIQGVSVVVTNGPFTGHQTVLVDRGSERVAYMGDLIPTEYHLQLPCISALDRSPDDTLAEKRRMLKMVTDGGWLVVFGHGHENYAGYVQQRNGIASLTPVEI